LVGTELGDLRADAEDAVAQAPLERAQVLPLEAVDLVARRVGLRDQAAGEVLAPVVVVALRARQVELTLAPVEGLLSRFEERLRLRVDLRRYRHPARLPPDVGGEREQLLALVGERRGFLMIDAAGVDALLEVERLAPRGVERGIARRDALH